MTFERGVPLARFLSPKITQTGDNACGSRNRDKAHSRYLALCSNLALTILDLQHRQTGMKNIFSSRQIYLQGIDEPRTAKSIY